MSFINNLIPQKMKTPACSMVVLAAGSSQRMGYDKITADLKGKPVILRTLQAFEDSEFVNEIIVVTRNESLAELSDIIAQAGLKKVKKVVEGGKTRAESSNIGIFQCNRNAKLIGIHDGARPLITEDVILRCAKGARSNRACIPGIPPTDTIKQIDVKPWVVDAEQMKQIKDEVFDYYGVNDDILQNKYNPETWAAFYEAVIEPFAIQFSEVMTRMLFTFREQSQGNRVTATANRLQYMSNADKLNVSSQLLDRGIMSINDVRDIWNLPPVDGGDSRIIRGEYYEADDKIGNEGNDGQGN